MTTRLIPYDSPAQRLLDCLPVIGFAALITMLTIAVGSAFHSCAKQVGGNAVAMEASNGR